MHLFTCEDVLEKILDLLILANQETRENWSNSEDNTLAATNFKRPKFWGRKETVMTFVLVSRSFLEVGRRALYRQPDLTLWGSGDAHPLFQGTLLHLNPHLGTYIRAFSTSTHKVGPLLLSRMVASMTNLQALFVVSLDFMNHFPDAMPIPRLAFLEVSPEDNGWRSKEALVETHVDDTRLRWILKSYEVRLRDLSIFVKAAIAIPTSEIHLHTLQIAQCRWDPSTHVDLIPCLATAIKKLVVFKFGKLYVRRNMWSDEDDVQYEWAGEAATSANGHHLNDGAAWESWTTSNRKKEAAETAGTADAMRSAICALARHVEHLTLEYSHDAMHLACMNLSLLTKAIKRCEVIYNKEMESRNFHLYPPNTTELYIRVRKPDVNLLEFVSSLRNPNTLVKLEACPEIWIRADSIPSETPADLDSGSADWYRVHTATIASLTHRGLPPRETPLAVELTEGEEIEWPVRSVKYVNFWAVPFALSSQQAA